MRLPVSADHHPGNRAAANQIPGNDAAIDLTKKCDDSDREEVRRADHKSLIHTCSLESLPLFVICFSSTGRVQRGQASARILNQTPSFFCACLLFFCAILPLKSRNVVGSLCSVAGKP